MWIDDSDFLEAEAMDDIKLLISDTRTPEEAMETLFLHGYPSDKVFKAVEDRFGVTYTLANKQEEKKDYKEEWKKKASKLIRSELEKRDVALKDIYEQLVKDGEQTTYENFTIKLNRGTFPAYLLFKIMDILDIKQLDLTQNYKGDNKK